MFLGEDSYSLRGKHQGPYQAQREATEDLEPITQVSYFFRWPGFLHI